MKLKKCIFLFLISSLINLTNVYADKATDSDQTQSSVPAANKKLDWFESFFHTVTSDELREELSQERIRKSIKTLDAAVTVNSSEWKPSVLIPAIKAAADSSDPNAILKGSFFTGTGGGISYYEYSDISVGNQTPQRNVNFCWTPIYIILNGTINLTNSQSTPTQTSVGLAGATSVGFFNNALMLGVGFDLGDVPTGQSRLFGLIGTGIFLGK